MPADGHFRASGLHHMLCFQWVESLLPGVVCSQVFEILSGITQAFERNSGEQGRPAASLVEGKNVGIVAFNYGTGRGVRFGSILDQREVLHLPLLRIAAEPCQFGQVGSAGFKPQGHR